MRTANCYIIQLGAEAVVTQLQLLSMHAFSMHASASTLLTSEQQAMASDQSFSAK